jgi:hypothetical protein
MASTVRITEGDVATRPSVSGLSAAAAAVPAEVIWRRLESWCAHRWGARTVEFIVEGPGCWAAPVRPFTFDEADLWIDGGWQATLLDASPLGYWLDGETYRISGTVGAATAPADVLEAFRRLAEYHAQANAALASTGGAVAAESESEGDYRYQRSPTWIARALHLSGASDLLRPYRIMGAS